MIDLAPLLHGFATALTPYHLALMAGGVLLASSSACCRDWARQTASRC
jgi:hypothetical protein